MLGSSIELSIVLTLIYGYISAPTFIRPFSTVFTALIKQSLLSKRIKVPRQELILLLHMLSSCVRIFSKLKLSNFMTGKFSFCLRWIISDLEWRWKSLTIQSGLNLQSSLFSKLSGLISGYRFHVLYCCYWTEDHCRKYFSVPISFREALCTGHQHADGVPFCY